ncbi:hypothetical protein VTL71DRAFT_4771 [Oculimacula yallundae]|uniref:Uncharacterized protein n=1 Tax=Oculimacula yallundae TaxID=86028 RepID=A0ABR4C431_9HELO
MEEIYTSTFVGESDFKFVIAYQQFDLLDKPTGNSVAQDVFKWQKDNLSLLARFPAFLKRIFDAVTDTDHGHFEVSWDGQGPLCITEQIGGGRSALPANFLVHRIARSLNFCGIEIALL